MIETLWYPPQESWGRRALLAPLTAASWAFGAAVATRRWAYRAGLFPRVRAAAPVISVGNLVAGGAGKTPVALHLAERLMATGRKVAILSRGYGRRTKGVVVASDGAGGARASAADAGDEPALLARRLEKAVVLVGLKRSELAELACARFGAEVLVLDDGFQHLGLARDLDVVVLDASAPFGNGRLLPRGPLREGPRSLDRAQLVWLSQIDRSRPEALQELRALALRTTGRAPVESRYRPSAVLDAGGGETRPPESLRGAAVLLLAALARPDGFRATLAALGARVLAEVVYRDHHPFTRSELEAALARARALGCDAVVCTEKDAVRLPALPAGAPVAVLRVDVEVVSGVEALEEALAAALARRADAGRAA